MVGRYGEGAAEHNVERVITTLVTAPTREPESSELPGSDPSLAGRHRSATANLT